MKARIIDGQYHILNDADKKWTVAYNDVADIANALAALDDDTRLEVMRLFCAYCGCIQTNPICQCWNDE